MLTTVAIVVGVAFVVGSFVLTDSLAASIDRLLSDATGNTDLVVRGVDSAGARGGGRGGGMMGMGSSRAGLDASVAKTVAAVPGVDAVDVSILGVGQLLDKSGNADGFDFSAVSNWPDHPEMAAVTLKSGRAPAADDEVVIDTTTAEKRKLDVGDKIRVGTRLGVIDAIVVGTAQRGAGNLGAAGTIVAFTTSGATKAVGVPDKIDSISVRLAQGVSGVEGRAAVQKAIGATGTVLDADTILADARQRIQDRLANFNSLMLGFASVTLFVSIFMIWNTFSIVVAQRRKELALLRAVGAGSRQVFWSIVGEGVGVGAVASAFGLGIGVLIAIGLRNLLANFGVDLPSGDLVMAPRTIIAAVVVGLGVTVLSVAGPARRTMKIPPVAALRDAAVPARRVGRVVPILGIVALALGVAAGAMGLRLAETDTTAGLMRLGIGAVLIFLGVAAVARFVTPPTVKVLGAPFAKLAGVPGFLARRNAVRDPRRTAATASALMIGLALVSLTLVLGASVQQAFGGALRASILTEAVVDAGGIVPIEADTLEKLEAVDGVTSVTPIRFVRAGLKVPGASAQAGSSEGGDDHGPGNSRDRIGLTIGTGDQLGAAVDPKFVEGSWPATAQEIAVSTSYATDLGLKVGDTLTPVDTNRTLTIVGRYERSELLDDGVVLPEALNAANGKLVDRLQPTVRQVLVGTAEDPVPTSVVKALGAASALVPNSSAGTVDQFVADQTSSLDIVLGIVNVLLLFAVIVAALGIANTLALSVVERTRELGLLRSVGMQRRQMRRMIRIEGVLVAVFGGVLGVGLGVLFGIAIASALPAETAVLTIPYARLGLILLAAAVLGVVAAAMPARRAGRLQVLDAIAEA